MTALIIVLAVLAALLALPVGVDAAYGPEGAAVALKLGPFRVRLLPGRAKAKPSRTKKAKPSRRPGPEKKPGKKKPDLKLILEAAKAGLRALGRFRRRLSVDQFRLCFTSGSPDPYRAAMGCAYVSALLGALGPEAARVFRVQESRVETCVDFQAEKSRLDVRAVLSIRIWELLYVGLALGAALLGCWRRYQKRQRDAAARAGASEERPSAGETAGETVKSA